MQAPAASTQVASGQRHRYRSWWHAVTRRLLRPNTPSAVHTLHQRHIYVLPTRAGWGLFVTLLVLLIASINFQLNLGYALTFLVLGSAVASLWWGYRNMYGIALQVAAIPPVFVGQSVCTPMQLQHHSKTPRFGLSLALRLPPQSLAWSHTDVPPGPAQTLQLGWMAPQRGWQPMPSVVIESRYPLGIFRLWSVWQPQTRVLLYPAPEVPMPAIQHSEAHHSRHGAVARTRSVETDGVRSYQRGDSLRSIAWKKTATALASGSGEVVVREPARVATHSLWLDAQATGVATIEAQIARLTAWVLYAHTQHWEWGLILPSGLQLPVGSGHSHLHACLHALAVDSLPATHAPSTH